MDNERIVGKINDKEVYFDGFIYYIKIDGNIIAVDESRLNLK